MDIREAFEKFASQYLNNNRHLSLSERVVAALALDAAWHHLYPEIERLMGLVEAGYVEGWSDGFEECADQHDIHLTRLPLAEWDGSTAKAKLEGE